MHPDVSQEGIKPTKAVSLNDNCLGCHSDNDVDYFYQKVEFAHPIRSTRILDDIGYDPFFMYNYPWWYENEWVIDRYSIDENDRTKIFNRKRIGLRRQSGGLISPSGGVGSTRGISTDGSSGYTVPVGVLRAVNPTTSSSGSSSGTKDRSSSGNSTSDSRSRDNTSASTGDDGRSRGSNTPGNSGTPAQTSSGSSSSRGRR